MHACGITKYDSNSKTKNNWTWILWNEWKQKTNIELVFVDHKMIVKQNKNDDNSKWI